MRNAVPLRDEAAIAARITELAGQISADYAGRTIDVVYMLNGASSFCADLLRRLTVPARVHPFGFVSYAGGNANGEVRVTLDVAEPLHGRDVLVVEGIVVTGRTPRYLLNLLRVRQPASIALCALGVKRASVDPELNVEYAAFDLGDEIVVGYGIGEGGEKALPFLAARQPVTTGRPQ
jgi:hypoxanthine phosphoribosyltransferase